MKMIKISYKVQDFRIEPLSRFGIFIQLDSGQLWSFTVGFHENRGEAARTPN